MRLIAYVPLLAVLLVLSQSACVHTPPRPSVECKYPLPPEALMRPPDPEGSFRKRLYQITQPVAK